MRVQSLAKTICHKSEQDGILTLQEKLSALKMIDSGEMDRCFLFVNQKAVTSGYGMGWNKVWHGSNLLNWYGTVSATQPIRCVAFELELEETVWDKCRQRLSQQESNVTPETDLISKMLSIFGSSKGNLKLLQRLNLDYRERPFVERWSWTGETGVAYLSDGGKFQIWKDLVWLRAIEQVLDGECKIPSSTYDCLADLNPGENELHLPEYDDDWIKIVKVIELYGCGKLLGDKLIMRSGIGTTAASLCQLYNQEVN